MNIINQRLQELRDEYKTASLERKKQIEITASLIKKSAHLYKPPKSLKPETKDIKKKVAESLF